MGQRLIITFDQAEQEALERLAEEQLRPVREQLRLLVREEAKRRGFWPPKQQPAQRPAQPAAA
jgi:hypothetical protein